MHRVEQMGRCIRRAAPVVPHCAMRKMVINLARVYCSAFAYKLQEELCSLHSLLRPGITVLSWNTDIRARMHQRVDRACHKAVVDEEVFFDAEMRVAALEIANAVVLDPVTQY